MKNLLTEGQKLLASLTKEANQRESEKSVLEQTLKDAAAVAKETAEKIAETAGEKTKEAVDKVLKALQDAKDKAE